MSVRSLWFTGFVASLFVLFFGIWFQFSKAQHWTPVDLPRGLSDPGLAVQLATPPWPEEMLKPVGNRELIESQQYIDYGYIPSYAALFLVIAILQSHSERLWVQFLGPICVVLTLLTVMYDLCENRAILAWAWPEIRPNALMKWGLVFLIILLEAPFYWTVKSNRIARVLGVLALASGAVGLYSVFNGNEKGIEMATLPLLVTMLAMPLFLWLGWRNASLQTE